jgi:hypothetical protein
MSHWIEGTFFKTTFLYIWNHIKKNTSLDCNKFFGVFSSNYKVYMFKVWHKSKMFLCVQSTQISKVENPYFSKKNLIPNVHHY